MSETRSVPLHCPYCADEDLRPDTASHGAWRCTACLRVFSVRLHGIVPVESVTS